MADENFFIDLEALAERIELSRNLIKASGKSLDEIAELYNIKTNVEFDAWGLSSVLEEIEEEVLEYRDIFKHTLEKDYAKDEINELIKSSVSTRLHIGNIVEFQKKLKDFKERFEIESENLEFATCLANLVAPLIKIRAYHDVIPLISRGIYSENIRDALEFWRKNNHNELGKHESTWQEEMFKRKSILGRVLGGRIFLLNQQAHVGADNLDGRGGKISDYLFQHADTLDVTLVEIKTPHKKLLGQEYRGTYALSSELSGTISQVLVQRNELFKNYYQKAHSSEQRFEVFAPRCVVVAGNVHEEIASDEAKRKAFELQRQALSSSVLIYGFDEIYDQFSNFNVI